MATAYLGAMCAVHTDAWLWGAPFLKNQAIACIVKLKRQLKWLSRC